MELKDRLRLLGVAIQEADWPETHWHYIRLQGELQTPPIPVIPINAPVEFDRVMYRFLSRYSEDESRLDPYEAARTFWDEGVAEGVRRREASEGLRGRLTQAEEGIEAAWGIIANVSAGNWRAQSLDWQQAAARWRDKYVGEIASESGRRFD